MEYFAEIYPIEDVPQELHQIIQKDYEMDESSSFGEIYEEQLIYLNSDNIKNAYFVATFKFPHIYLGGVFLFLTTSYNGHYYIDTPSPGFQGIAKSLQGRQFDFKLNKILIPTMVNFLKELGFSEVYVSPVGNQRKILIEHYGFSVIEYFNDEILVLKF